MIIIVLDFGWSFWFCNNIFFLEISFEVELFKQGFLEKRDFLIENSI